MGEIISNERSMLMENLLNVFDDNEIQELSFFNNNSVFIKIKSKKFCNLEEVEKHKMVYKAMGNTVSMFHAIDIDIDE